MMPTIKIQGRRVTVDDAFMNLSPEEQSRTVDEIAASLPKEPERREPTMGSAAIRGAGQGATFGLADEIAGGAAQKKAMLEAATDRERLRAMVDAAQKGDMETYRNLQRGVFDAGYAAQDKATEEYRAADAAAREAYPKTFMASEIGGGLVPAMAGIGFAGNAARGAGIGMRSLASAGAGAGEAAVYGFNTDEGDLASRAKSALIAAPFGFAVGGAIPGTGTLIGKGARAVSSMIPGNRVPKTVQQLAAALGRDKMGMDDAVRRVADLGDDAIPADVGPNTVQLAKGIARLPGEGQTILRDAVSDRAAKAKTRMASAVDDAFGPRQNQYTAQVGAKAARRAAAKKGYGEVFAKNWGDAGPPFELDDILKRLDPSDFAEARAMARADGSEFGRTLLADIADDGTVAIKRMPSLEEAEYLRRAVADRADRAFKSGSGGAGQSIKELSRELRDVLDNASPELKAMRGKYADDSAVIAARDKGRKLFSRAVDFDELEATAPGMSEAERQAMREGARSNVADFMDEASWNAQDSLRRLRTDRNIDKAGTVLPRDKVDAIVKALENERVKQLTNAEITRGSDTAANQAAFDLLGANPNRPDAGTIRSALNLQFGDAAAKLFDKVGAARSAAKSEATRAALARMLSDPQELIKAAQYGPRIAQMSKQEQEIAAIARALLSSTPRTTGAAIAQAQGLQRR